MEGGGKDQVAEMDDRTGYMAALGGAFSDRVVPQRLGNDLARGWTETGQTGDVAAIGGRVEGWRCLLSNCSEQGARIIVSCPGEQSIRR